MVHEPDLSSARIGQISLNVSDVDRAVAFYRDALGMKFLFQVPKMAFFDCLGVRLLLGVPESAESERRASILYFQVLDLPAVYATLRSRGVQFLGEPHMVAKLENADLWMVFFRDSEGNTLALMSEQAR